MKKRQKKKKRREKQNRKKIIDNGIKKNTPKYNEKAINGGMKW